MSSPRISLANVSKVYPLNQRRSEQLFSAMNGDAELDDGAKHKVAVADVSLDISKGDRVGIVGRNGAGKSTLLHVIAGLTEPSSGRVTVEGMVTAVMTLGIGLRDDLSGRENIYLDGEILGKTRAQVATVIDDIIDFSDLGKFIDYPIRTYSTGMKARLAFSMISHIDPEILIIDEALSVGDADFSKKATARIREICERGKIVIVVSHSMQSIRDICNRCLWIDNGRVVMDGSPEKVTNAYIDAVRSADEAELLEKFKHHLGKHTYSPGWTFDSVKIMNGGDSQPRTLLEAGLLTQIQIRGKVPRQARDACMRVRIVRLDDLLLFDEKFEAGELRIKHDEIAIEIEMERLQLGAAIYRLDISACETNVLCADISLIFEVFSRNPPMGGKPMLFPAAFARVERA